VLSPASASSKICAWEVEEATRHNKRIIPVLPCSLEDAKPPQALQVSIGVQNCAPPSLRSAILSLRCEHEAPGVLVWIVGTVAWPFTASGASSGDLPAKIGWLKIQGPRHTLDQIKAFRDGMTALGQIERRNTCWWSATAAAARVTKTVPIIGRFTVSTVLPRS
jgi:hypothetical protein